MHICIIILGDFNALVRRFFEIRNVLGYSIGKINANSQKLLELSSELKITIYNTRYWQKLKYKVTWTHPRLKHGHKIDFIITYRCDISGVCNVQGSLNKFPDIFRMGTFIDSIHMKLKSSSK